MRGDPNQGIKYIAKVMKVRNFIAADYQEKGTLDLEIDGDLVTQVNLTPGDYVINVPRGMQLLLPGKPNEEAA